MDNMEILQIFTEESSELINKIEVNVLKLEEGGHSSDVINETFRYLHTIKGSAAMFGLTRISYSTHLLENKYDALRKGLCKMNKSLADLTLLFCDGFRKAINLNELENPDFFDGFEEMISQEEIEAKMAVKNSEASLDPHPVEMNRKKIPISYTESENINNQNETLYRVLFIPGPDVLKRGVNPGGFIEDLMELGECHVFTHTHRVPRLKEYAVDVCYVKWSFLINTCASPDEIRDVFLFAQNDSEIIVSPLIVDRENINYKQIGQILLEKHDISLDELQEILSEKKLFGETAVSKGYISDTELKSALVEQNLVKQKSGVQQNRSGIKTIRVEHNKLDDLINLVGELVTLDARLKQFQERDHNNELEIISDRFSRLISDLREKSMSLRMVPLETLFNGFRRLVRDLSTQLKKDVSIVIEGGDTAIDKNIIESLKDPLIHIIRNCIDHGIESVEEREKQGKPFQGVIHVKARYSGAYVEIVIHDDGAGINVQKVKMKAEKKGLIPSGSALSTQEAINLIFLPGFSSIDKATEISGRGVGMDIVKKNIENLRGMVIVKTVPGQGTEFVIRIPLTLAIIEGLLFQVGESYFIINMAVIEECLEYQKEFQSSKGSRILRYRDQVIPYLDLRDLFHIPGERPENEQLILVNTPQQTIGIKVDRALRKHQTVIKSITQAYSHVEEVSGATILGNGTVALILDINKIAQRVEKQTRQENTIILNRLGA